MKKLLFALIAFITVSVAAPVAEAGQFARVYGRHGVQYVHKSQVYGGHYYRSSRQHYGHHRNRYRAHYARPVYYSRPVSYSRPVYYSRPSYSHYRPHCGYRSSPRIAISFGF